MGDYKQNDTKCFLLLSRREQPISSNIENPERQPLSPKEMEKVNIRSEEEDPITDSTIGTNANDDQSENLQM